MSVAAVEAELAAIALAEYPPTTCPTPDCRGRRAWHRHIAVGQLLASAAKRAEGVWKRDRAASEEAVGELYRPRDLRAEVLEQFPPKARRLARAA